MVTPIARQSNDICFFGLKGSGKSLAMGYYAFKKYLADYEIFSNYAFIFPYTPVKSLYDVQNLMEQTEKKKILIIDDAERWLDSKFLTLGQKKGLLNLTLDLGKAGYGCDIWFSGKRPVAIEKGLRATTDLWIECTMVLKNYDLKSYNEFLDYKRYLDNYMIQMDTYDGNLEYVCTSYLDNLPVWGELYDTKQTIKKLEV